MNCPRVRGGAGLAPAAGLIRSLSACLGVTHYRPAAAVSLHQTGTTGPYERNRRIGRMLADELDYVVGVDTHRDEHVLAVVAAPAGAVVARQAVERTGVATGRRFASPSSYAAGRRAWAIEGTGSYGAGLARYLAGRGETVLEISRTPRAERRLRGKDDALDAARTARAALASETLALPRAGERREALRLLLVARRSAVDVRREALVQLRGVIVTAPEQLREELRGLPAGRLLDRCSRLRRSSSAAVDELATGSCCAASPAASRRPHAKPPSSSAKSSATSAHSHPAARRARRRPDRRRATDRRLVTPRPAALRSLLRAARRRRTRPRLERPNHVGSGSAAAATANSTAHSTPSSSTAASTTRDQGLHRPPHRRRQKPPRGHPPAQALPRPPPLPLTPEPGAADDLTGHRSFIPAHWPMRRFPLQLQSCNYAGLCRSDG